MFTQEREDDASRRRAYHSRDEGLSSSQSSSVGHKTGRPVGDQLDPLISNFKETPRRGSENEQIKILVERQRDQILADCQAEIRKHEFQAREEQLRRDQQLLHEQLLAQSRELREAHEKSQ